MTLTTRTPLARRGGLERRTGLRVRTAGLPTTRTAGRVAGRRRPGLDVPTSVRELLRTRSAGRCEAALMAAGCTQAATDVHHRQRRRDGGHAIPNLLDLCRACHSWAHAHPAAARELGLIVSAYEDPATVPVRVLSRLTGAREAAHLTADGGLELEAAPW